jgi:hypothetical protein
MNLHKRACATRRFSFDMSISEQSTAEGKALKEGEERWERSEDGGIDIAGYYKSISVSKMQKKRKLTITVINMGSNVEIVSGVQCIKGGTGRCPSRQWQYRYRTILQKY